MSEFEINNLCYEIVNYYNKGLYNKSNPNEKRRIEETFRKLSMIINSKFIKSLNKNYNAFYYIYLFCIMFKEHLLSKEDIYGIIINVENYDTLSILQMNMKLDDDIVLRILKAIDEDKAKLYTGNIPYDYRYHILRRKEISQYIKNRVLRKYSKEELKVVIDQINADFEEGLYFLETRDLQEAQGHQHLSDEYHVSRVLEKKYFENK